MYSTEMEMDGPSGPSIKGLSLTLPVTAAPCYGVWR